MAFPFQTRSISWSPFIRSEGITLKRARSPTSLSGSEDDKDELQDIIVKRRVVVCYRDRKGGLSTETHPDRPGHNVPTKVFKEVPHLIVYRELDENGEMCRRYLDINSWSFIQLLRQVEKFTVHSQSQDSMSTDIRFVEPFVDLFYRRDGLRGYVESVDPTTPEMSVDVRENMACATQILQLLDNEFSSIGNTLDSFDSSQPPSSINYTDLWMIYRPGKPVFGIADDGEPICLMVDSVVFEIPGPRSEVVSVKNMVTLHCWAIDYDGQRFRRRGYSIVLGPFVGTMEISNLPWLPERFLKDADKIKATLKTRGRAFWDMQGQSYRQLRDDPQSALESDEAIRVMVDEAMYRSLRARDTDAAMGSPLYEDDNISHVAHVDGIPGGVLRGARVPINDLGIIPGSNYSKVWFNEYDNIDPASEPDELVLMLCPRKVHAFCMRDKLWHEYSVSKLEPVQFRENAWSRLVLEREYKDVVQAMVKSYLSKTFKFQDLVLGKGAGLVILLHGPPGVGKTLTAECVAELFQKPLYMVTAGDLGTNPHELELKLSTIFDYAVRWNAILLLDEADVFLQDRDYENLSRNALVSIFLRTLEYFNGIMFLTSNRVGALDQAFQSRIHITLGIPEFDWTRRKDVWGIFIKDLGRKRPDGSPPLLTHDECRELGREVVASWAKEPINGRQIRNCVRSALALAADKGEKLSAKHFNTVIQLGNTFTQYMKRLQKAESEEIAQMKGDRLATMRDIMMETTRRENENHGGL